MSEERSIQDYLDDILNAVYGEEVRGSIVGAITKCYEDGRTGAVDVIARGRLDVVEPIAENAQDTANANVLASLQAEKKFTLEGVNDINAAIEPGKYYADSVSVAAAVLNQPSDKTASITFAVLVLQHVATTNVIQILIDSQWKMWIRRGYLSGGAWTFGGWQRFLRSSDLSDINTALGTKANETNATLKGTPTAPTATAGTNNTQIATTAFVKSAVATLQTTVNTALAAKAPLASPALTGNPTAPTQAAGNNSTRIATTAFVNTAIANQSAATQSAKGLLSATDKTYLDGTQTKTYGLYTRLSNITIDTARMWVYNRRGNICDVTFNFKITVHDANISASTAIIGSLPDCSVNAYVVMATKTGDSMAIGYVSGGKFYTGGTLTKDKTYYGNMTYCSNDANDWYEAIG